MGNVSITMKEKKKSTLIIESDGIYKIVEEVSEDESHVKISEYLKSIRSQKDQK